MTATNYPTLILPSRERRQRITTGDQTVTLFYTSSGTTDTDLSLIHLELQRSVTEATATLYCRHFQMFRHHLEALGLDWLALPIRVRQAAADYLRQAGAAVRPKGDDLAVHRTPDGQHGRQVYRLMLESLRAVYRTARKLGIYAHPDDPFVRMQVRSRKSGPPHPPARSGLTRPPAIRADRAHYFVLKDSEWLPQHILDPKLCERVLTAFTAPGRSLRDLIIVRLLIETGARVSEICALTMEGWRQSQDGKSPYGQTFKVTNKGHGDRPRKWVICSRTTSDLMHKYFVTERVVVDPLREEFENWTSESMTPANYDIYLHATNQVAPLFLNSQGRPYTANAWRKGAWRPTLTAAGLSVRPHQIRHWYVTSHLRYIAQHYKQDPIAYQQHRAALGQYMYWATPERMLATYDQTLSDTTVLELVADVSTHLQSLSTEQQSELMGAKALTSQSPRAQKLARLIRGDLP